MCVDEEHVRALADQAAELHKPGIKPVGSAGWCFSFVSFYSIKENENFH